MKKPFLKIFVISFSCSLLFNACTIVKIAKLSSNQEINLISNKKIYFPIEENNRIVLNEDINMMLDTGAPNCFFDKSKKQFVFSDSLIVGSLKNSFGKELDNKLYVCDWNNALFNSKNLVLRSLPYSFECNTGINGLIGSETFIDKILSINFENRYIEVLDDFKNEDSLYSSVEVSKFDGYFFDVNINILGVKYPFRFDTGNNYDAILTDENASKININYSSTENNTNIGLDKTISFIKEKVQIANFNDNAIFLISKSLKRNLLGVGFMKNYNWILDYKKGKIYAKKNNSTDKLIYKSKSFSKLNKLIINYSDILKPGDQIISVNNQKVTPENICEMQTLLNNTQNWETLKLEVIPAKKE
jgi:predicted aspartyl protease